MLKQIGKGFVAGVVLTVGVVSLKEIKKAYESKRGKL